MNLTYHIPLAMASAKSHWLLMFPSQSGSYPKVISRGRDHAPHCSYPEELISVNALWNYFLPNYCCHLGRMVYLFQLKITVVEMHILFEFLHILLAISLCYTSLDDFNSDFQTCSTVFLLLSLAHQHLVSGLLHSPSVPFLNSTLRTHHFHSSNLIPKQARGRSTVERPQGWGSGCHWVKILPCMVRRC